MITFLIAPRRHLPRATDIRYWESVDFRFVFGYRQLCQSAWPVLGLILAGSQVAK